MDGTDRAIMTRAEIAAFFDGRQALWRQRDAAALAHSHSATCVVESPAAGTVTGREAIQEIYAAWFRAFPDLDMHFTDLVIDGDRVVLTAFCQGTNVGGFMGLPASGKRFKFPVVMVCTLADGEIVHERRIYDFTGMLIQIGMLKAKPA
jgi:steroid delta-isomerase-like uncharacterized protein